MVSLGDEIGRGSFGIVYKGNYNHPELGVIECAIKTVNEGATYRDRIQFLVEAHVMK